MEEDQKQTNEEPHLIQMFQCTKEQYDNRDSLEPKELTAADADLE